MRIVIVGSGLIGVTAAYLLRQRGHEVVVLDRQQGPGLGASFANGALLTPSMPEPWNAPGCWRVLLRSLGRTDAAMQLRLKALPSLASWGITFLRNSSAAAFTRNTLSNLALALHSLDVMGRLRRELAFDFGSSTLGSLRIFRAPAALAQTLDHSTCLAEHGLRLKRLTSSEVVDLEPALAPIGAHLAGAIHYENDETGNAYRFCVSLMEIAQARGVEFHFGAEATGIQTSSGRVTAIACGERRYEGDLFVVAAGSHSRGVLGDIGMRVPVQPVKGYSVTFERGRHDSGLQIPVIDDHFHAAVVPIDGAIRVAGTAEFAGFDLRPNPRRIQNLLTLLEHVLPGAQLDIAAAKPWCGLRPMSADGVPIIGASRLRNLMISTGHGHLGWTMAAGSAQLLADLVCDVRPEIDPSPYSPLRFH